MPQIHSTSEDSAPVIGLLAAWGRYPLIVAETLKARGYRVFCLGVKGHADRNLAAICDDFDWVGLAKLGRAGRWFRNHGVSQATMAGKIHKVNLFDPYALWQLMPDWTTFKSFYPHFIAGSSDKKDDTLLLAVVDTFARQGIEFLPATDFAPDLLIGPGQIAGCRLSRNEQADVEFGWHLARRMGALDVGQSVCVKGLAALAIEAVEGTDRCIERAGQLCRQGGFTVVKTAKPQQDMRFDVPAVGIKTLQTMAEAGGRVLAVQADSTILLDRQQFERQASTLGITVVSLRASDSQNGVPIRVA